MKVNLKYARGIIETKIRRLERGTLTPVQKSVIRSEFFDFLELIESLEKELREKLAELRKSLKSAHPNK